MAYRVVDAKGRIIELDDDDEIVPDRCSVRTSLMFMDATQQAHGDDLPSILGLFRNGAMVAGPSPQPALASVEDQSNIIPTHSRTVPGKVLERN